LNIKLPNSESPRAVRPEFRIAEGCETRANCGRIRDGIDPRKEGDRGEISGTENKRLDSLFRNNEIQLQIAGGTAAEQATDLKLNP
jgi:hypothetical protein